MEFLGIGPSELLLILVIMLVVLGPQDMVKMGRQLSQVVRKVINSSIWKSMMSTSQEIRDLPTKLVRETGLDEDLAEIRKSTRGLNTPVDKDLKSILSTASVSLTTQTATGNGKKTPVAAVEPEPVPQEMPASSVEQTPVETTKENPETDFNI